MTVTHDRADARSAGDSRVAATAGVSPGGVPTAAVSTRQRRRRPMIILGLAGVVLLCVVLSIAIGAKPIPIGDVWAGLVNPEDGENDVIIRSLRVPRTILGLLVGAALGIAGALMQGHTRNPLADPGLLGVEAGAAFAVVLAIYSFGITDTLGFVWFAFAGALVASLVVFALGSLGQGAATPVTLALAGAAVSALLGSFTSALILMDRQTLDVFRFWQVGALTGRPTRVIWEVLPFLIVGLLLALYNAPALNLLSLGEDVARSLGQSVFATRAIGIAAITLLTGAAVSAAGPIGFVGLVVPHIARIFTGPDYRWLLPCSALLGGSLVLLTDTIGRVVVRPGEMQVGIIMALVGAPFFIWLVRRRRLAAL